MPLNGKNISKGSYDFQQDSQGLYNFRMDSRGHNLPDLGGQIALATLYASFFHLKITMVMIEEIIRHKWVSIIN